MLAWAAWLENTPVALALRTGVYDYPAVNIVHVLGVALLFGAIAALDLRLLGLWRGVPVGMLARPLLPLAGAGLVLAALSGLLLLTAQAVDYAQNPVFLVKFAAIGVGAANVALTHRIAGWRSGEPTRRLAVAGGLSLAAWFTAVAAGRFIAYW